MQIPKDLAGGQRAAICAGTRCACRRRSARAASRPSAPSASASPRSRARRATRLRAVLSERVIGPTVARGRDARARAARAARAADGQPSTAACSTAASPDQRAPAYRKQVTRGRRQRLLHVLCLDLSVGGMRIEPIEGLGVDVEARARGPALARARSPCWSRPRSCATTASTAWRCASTGWRPSRGGKIERLRRHAARDPGAAGRLAAARARSSRSGSRAEPRTRRPLTRALLPELEAPPRRLARPPPLALGDARAQLPCASPRSARRA